MPFTIELDFADMQGMWQSGSAAAPFRADHHMGRFECHDHTVNAPDEWDSVADRLLAAPEFDDGSLLWCDTYVEALLLAKVHRASGHTAYILWDMAENDHGDVLGHCVLTSWDVMSR